jgi:hypothetical protein
VPGVAIRAQAWASPAAFAQTWPSFAGRSVQEGQAGRMPTRLAQEGSVRHGLQPCPAASTLTSSVQALLRFQARFGLIKRQEAL